MKTCVRKVRSKAPLATLKKELSQYDSHRGVWKEAK